MFPWHAPTLSPGQKPAAWNFLPFLRIGVAPALGANNDEVLAHLGYSEQQIGDFRARKVI